MEVNAIITQSVKTLDGPTLPSPRNNTSIIATTSDSKNTPTQELEKKFPVRCLFPKL